MSLSDSRQIALLAWLREVLCLPVEGLEPASADASFRRYFRTQAHGQSRIAMDAPPPRENVRPFLAVSALMREAGVKTPRVDAAEPEQGFVLLEDFGDRNYLDALDASSADRLYGDALDTLFRLQTGIDLERAQLPVYDEAFVLRELEIFCEWFLTGLLELPLRPQDQALLAEVWRILAEAALEQPKVCVHRDFHSRNLMVTAEDNPGVLDFQDAVIGPITYDVVSLLRDCYVAWPPERVETWLSAYRDRLVETGLLAPADVPRFGRWFDLMGMQRHLKAIGIFARLQLRDGKPGYLKDIPRTLAYVQEVSRAHPELHGFLDWLETRVMPRLALELPA